MITKMLGNNKLYKLYKSAYNMIIKALQSDNIYDSIFFALHEAKKFTKADAVCIYRLYNNNKLKRFLNTKFDFNEFDEMVEKNELDIINYDKYSTIKIINHDVKEINLLPITLNNNQKYFVLIINGQTKNLNHKFISIYTETFKTILEKMESVYQLKKQSEIDFLTQSGNRASYEKEVSNIIHNNDEPFIYALIDLFRLKYVNDNINHAAGDEYIKKVANLLNKYFPRYLDQKLDNGQIVQKDAGNYLFRIGGDEFVLISKFQTKSEVINNLEQLKKDLLQINLGNNTHPILGVNYGVVEKTNQESIDDLYRESDANLAKDKTKMYKVLRIDRRK